MTNTIEYITSEEALAIIETRQRKGLFIEKDGNIFVAIDNRTGDACTEDFATEAEAKAYLLDEEGE